MAPGDYGTYQQRALETGGRQWVALIHQAIDPVITARGADPVGCARALAVAAHAVNAMGELALPLDATAASGREALGAGQNAHTQLRTVGLDDLPLLPDTAAPLFRQDLSKLTEAVTLAAFAVSRHCEMFSVHPAHQEVLRPPSNQLAMAADTVYRKTVSAASPDPRTRSISDDVARALRGEERSTASVVPPQGYDALMAADRSAETGSRPETRAEVDRIREALGVQRDVANELRGAPAAEGRAVGGVPADAVAAPPPAGTRVPASEAAPESHAPRMAESWAGQLGALPVLPIDKVPARPDGLDAKVLAWSPTMTSGRRSLREDLADRVKDQRPAAATRRAGTRRHVPEVRNVAGV